MYVAYECLGTPPNSPPPMISPLLLTPSPGGSGMIPQLNVSPIVANVGFDTVQVLNRKLAPPNTLTFIPPALPTMGNYNSYILDNTVFMHNLQQSSCCNGSQTLSHYQHLSSFIDSASPTVFSKQHHHHPHHHSGPTQSVQIQSRSGSKRKNIYIYNCNGRQKPNSNKNQNRSYTSSEEDSRSQLKEKNVVYHGKRYLDPITTTSGIDSKGGNFRRSHYRTLSNAFGCSVLPEITETEGSFDSMIGVGSGNRQRMRRGSNSFPKFRVRINDEHGRRIHSSFDSTASEEIQSPQATPNDNHLPLATWSSLECDSTVAAAVAAKVDAVAAETIVSNENWTLPSVESLEVVSSSGLGIEDENDGADKPKGESDSLCEKCGHESSTPAQNNTIQDFKKSSPASSSVSSSSVSIEELSSA